MDVSRYSGGNPFPIKPTGGNFSAKAVPLSTEVGYLKAIQAQIANNPLAALSALSAWRDGGNTESKASVRWPTAAMPLRVWVDDPPGCIETSSRWMIEVMRQWEVGSGGLIRFRALDSRLSANAELADIHIGWSKETTVGRDYEVGHARRDVANQRIRHVDITFIESPLIDAHLTALQRKNRLIATILHETGHALGLEHAEHPHDVMYYRGWQNTQLSVNDLSRLNKLYQ